MKVQGNHPHLRPNRVPEPREAIMTSTPAPSPVSRRPVPAQPRNGFGIAALCVALVGLLFGLVPLTGFIATGLGMLGLVFALIGWTRARSGTATNGKMSVISLALATAATALGLWGMSITFQATDDFVNEMDKIGNEMSNAPAPPPMPEFPGQP